MRPKVTVWLPSYNHAPYLAAAIESALAQTLDEMELVLVDDGSSDESLAIAERYAAANPGRMRVLTHPGHANRGVEASAWLAIGTARGDYLLGLASDDVLYPDALERAAAYLDRHPATGFVYGYAHLVDEAGRRIPDRRTVGSDITGGGRTLERLIQGNVIPSMTAMFRRECLEQTGGHDSTLLYSDWDLFLRAAAHWDVGFVPRALAMYRVHAANTSNKPPEVNRPRVLAVTAAVRARAEEAGGRFAEPRIRALLDLQLAFLRYASGDEPAARSDVAAAFDDDPALGRDAAWLGDWVWARSLDPLLTSDRGFAAWVEAQAAPRLGTAARQRLHRHTVVATRAARAVECARDGRGFAATCHALAAAARAPRRAADRKLAAQILDASPRAAKGVRRTKRLLLPHR